VDNILAIDPGGTTGIAEFDYGTLAWKTHQFEYRPVELFEFFHHWMILRAAKDATVICERFDYRPVGKYNFGGSRAIPKVDLTPREVIGILKLAAAYTMTEIVWQAPGDVNGDDGTKTANPSVFWTDAKVKQLDLYKAANVHAMDAVKHILYYRSFTLKETDLFVALRPTNIFKESMQ
jgi:hypothetical protein